MYFGGGVRSWRWVAPATLGAITLMLYRGYNFPDESASAACVCRRYYHGHRLRIGRVKKWKPFDGGTYSTAAVAAATGRGAVDEAAN